MIDKSQYGDSYNFLSAASYKLTHHFKGRGIYSFCMCPGGYVVNSSSENGGLVVNGMSNYKRDTENSNSAIIVTVDERDYGEGVFAGIHFQRDLEEKAYILGGGRIPVQKYVDFKNNKTSESLGDVFPVMKGALIDAIESFDAKIHGFAKDDSILAGIESRTSSPIRIERDSLGVSNILGIYPSGEGAGYAGGIMSSAVDGIVQAENIAKIYSGFSSNM